MRTAILLLIVLLEGCSLQHLAANKIGDALSASGTTYASDDDPELVAAALPFSLKLVESVLAETPKHRPLLITAASGFTQYAYGWVSQRADELEATDLPAATAQRLRARALYLRARNYGLRALGARDERIVSLLRTDSARALGLARREDVPALYWTAAAWGLAISLGKDDPELVADLPIVGALINRAAELDPDFGGGAIDTFLISYPLPLPASRGEGSRAHFERAVQLSEGKLASPYLALAESLTVQQQKRGEFERLLKTALAIDPNVKPEWRLQNLIAQRRAAWLLSREDDLFIEGGAQ